MLSVLTLAGLATAFILLHTLQQYLYHRRQAKLLHCGPVAYGGHPLDRFFGVVNYLRVSASAKENKFLEDNAAHLEYMGKNTMELRIFTVPVLMTAEPDNVQAMLAKQFRDFYLGTRYQSFHPLLGDGIFTLDGHGWSKARALLRPQFARDQITDLALVDDHLNRLIQQFPKDRSAFDIQHLLYLFTLDSSTHFLFGESIGSLVSSHQTVLEKSSIGSSKAFADAFNLSQDYLISRARAAKLWWLVDSKDFREANRKIHEVVDHYVNLAIQKHNNNEKKETKQNEDGEAAAEENDRYVFLEALAADTQNPRVLRDNLLNMLLAGRDTTASLLSSAFYYLARHRGVWNRLRKEVLNVFGDAANPKAEITHSRLKDVAYLRYVINETLRLLPPVPTNYRVSAKDTTLPVGGGDDEKAPIYIRKGTHVAYSVYIMQRRKDIWGPDANVFRPERWEENAKHGWAFLPFNGGPRICIGQQYALTEASYVLVKLLQHFNTIENADDTLGDGDEPVVLANLILTHERGVWVRLYSSEEERKVQ